MKKTEERGENRATIYGAGFSKENYHRQAGFHVESHRHRGHKQIEGLLGVQVFLDLWVKVKRLAQQTRGTAGIWVQ